MKKLVLFAIVLVVCGGIVVATVVSVSRLYATPHWLNMTNEEESTQWQRAHKQLVDDCFAAGGYQWVWGRGGCYTPTGINNEYPRTPTPYVVPIPNPARVWAELAATILLLLTICTPLVAIGTGIHLLWEPF